MEKSEGEDKDKEGAKGEEGEGKSDVNATVEMGETEGQDLMNWLKETLGARCTDVEATGRLVDSPAIVSEHDNAMTRRMMQMEEFKALGVNRQASYKLQVNLKHPLLRQLSEARSRDEAIAKVVAEQLLDNAILSAGILDGARDMVPRLTKLMEVAMGSK
jgi:TNF receptor-associated protein 1